MTAAQALPLAITFFLALAAWASLRQFGGRSMRPYAVPVAGAILIFGVDFVFDLPTWSYLIAILVTPFFFHRTVRSRLEKTARELLEIKAEGCDHRLLFADDIPGTHVAVWRIAPVEGSGSPQGLPLLKLEFQGEAEDEYQVLVWAPVKPFREVSLVLHHKEADTLGARLTKAEPVDVSGAPSWLVARSKPVDFALLVLDRRIMLGPLDIIGLRNDEREVVVQIDGGAMRVILNRTLEKSELELALRSFLILHERVCAMLSEMRMPGDD